MHEFIIQLQQNVMLPERIPVAVVAIILASMGGMIFGPLSYRANPLFFYLLDCLFGRAGEKADKLNRPAGDLIFRGFLFMVIVLAFVGGIGHGISRIDTGFRGFQPFEVVILACCITSGAIWTLMNRLKADLKNGGNALTAYLALSRSARINLNSVDDSGITRLGLSFLATSFDKAMVNPVFWYIFGGVPFLLIYSSLAFLSWRFGKSGFSKGFGVVPLAMERLLGYVPCLLAGFFLTAASALTPTAHMGRSVMAWWGEKDKAPYEQGGICISAMAWPLNIVIGGPVVDLDGSALQNAWVGPKGATAKIEPEHITRGLYLNIVAHLLFIAALLGAYLQAVYVF